MSFATQFKNMPHVFEARIDAAARQAGPPGGRPWGLTNMKNAKYVEKAMNMHGKQHMNIQKQKQDIYEKNEKYTPKVTK